MSIKKQFLKSKAVCKVSFKISKEQAANASEIAIVGDFNKWNPEIEIMKPLKDGSFSHTLELATGAEYQFRYLADKKTWLDEEEADHFAETAFSDAKNAVIVL